VAENRVSKKKDIHPAAVVVAEEECRPPRE
jgi:hypothetical protein